MTQPNKSVSRTDRKSSAGKSKSATQAAPSGKALKQSQLDEISAGKLLAQRAEEHTGPLHVTDEKIRGEKR